MFQIRFNPVVFVLAQVTAFFVVMSIVSAADINTERGQTFRDCADCPEMVVLASGQFTMGSAATELGRLENEGPQVKVTLSKRFAVSKFEVTVGQYGQFIKDSGHVSNNSCVVWTGVRGGEPVPGKNWKDPNFAQTDAHPVVCISWNDAKAYINWLSKKTGKAYRFLSEAEWEYAARAGTTTRYSFGDNEAEICKYANVPDASAKRDTIGSYWKYVECDDGYGTQTSPVGSYLPNQFGLYDMHGNVWEWVEDCYHDTFAGAPTDGTAWISKSDCTHVVRGGSLSAPVQISRSASRYKGDIEQVSKNAGATLTEWHNFNLGLRIARSVP